MSEPKKSLQARKFGDGWVAEIRETHTKISLDAVMALVKNKGLMVRKDLHNDPDNIYAE